MTGQDVVCRLSFRCAFEESVASVAGGLLEIVGSGAREFRDLAVADDALVTQLFGQFRNPAGVFPARLSQAVIQMCDAELDREFVGRSEFVERQQ